MFSKQFREAIEAKGIHFGELVRYITEGIEQSLDNRNNLNTLENFDPTYSPHLTVTVDLRYCVMTERTLAEKVGISRNTLKDWREKNMLEGTFYNRGRNIYYRRNQALRVIELILKDSPRSELLSGNIFKGL